MAVITKSEPRTERHTCDGECCMTDADGGEICVISPLERPATHPGRWKRVRASVMFGIACLASPCCTPLIVPVVLAALAGTPLALWLGQNLGWVYGALTVISAVSFVLALRWSNGRGARNKGA